MLKPLGSHIIIQPKAAETKTAGGLYVPETAQKKTMEGIVTAVGPGRWVNDTLIVPDIKVGDTVIYTKFGGTALMVNEEEFIILDEENVLAIREEGAANA